MSSIPHIPSGQNLAQAALDDHQPAAISVAQVPVSDETSESDQLAETLESLQQVIERNAQHLENLSHELKLKRESLKDVLENDILLTEANTQLQALSAQVKERKVKLQANAQVTSLQVQIGELQERKKEIEETLSNHLVNYHGLTHSTSFDTSDGDQWNFVITARVKTRRRPNQTD